MQSLNLNLKHTFNVFVSVHFFLNGLLPLYVPIFLIQRGYDLAWVSGFVSVSTVGFLAALYVWKKWYFSHGLKPILVASFLAQMCLISSLALLDHKLWLIVSAVLYGVVNCFLWTSQRVLFIDLLSVSTRQPIPSKNSVEPTGRLLGNFQILAVVAIKLGLLIGAFLLAHDSLGLLVGLAALVSIGAAVSLFKAVSHSILRITLFNEKLNKTTLTWKRMLIYRDRHFSRLMFYIDGAFLFAESFFWVLSLYFLSQQNIQQLSFLLVALSVVLGLVFWLLKNYIDRLNTQKVYLVAVLGYVVSWGLRAHASVDMEPYLINLVILMVAFLTAFFRLSFNKRLFDNSKSESPLAYILAKTYCSQVGAMVFFAGLAAIFYFYSSEFHIGIDHLNVIYWLLTIFSGLYLLYQLKTKPKTLNFYNN